MSVTLILSEYLAAFTDGIEEIDVNGNTIDDCLKDLIKTYPEIKDVIYKKNGKLVPYIATYVNGEDIYPNEQTRAGKDGDRVNVMYMIAGG